MRPELILMIALTQLLIEQENTRELTRKISIRLYTIILFPGKM